LDNGALVSFSDYLAGSRPQLKLVRADEHSASPSAIATLDRARDPVGLVHPGNLDGH
jgi:hypothetical protein